MNINLHILKNDNTFLSLFQFPLKLRQLIIVPLYALNYDCHRYNSKFDYKNIGIFVQIIL